MPLWVYSKTMNSPFKKRHWVSALLAVALLSACDRSDTPSLQIGKPCTIQFRRDALGAAASLPVPPMTGSINGADTSIAGTLKRSTAEWLVIEKSGDEIWIPKSVILLIQQRSQ